MISAKNIVNGLGGVNAVATALCIKPPSVYGWLKNDRVPDDKLVLLAARIENLTSSWPTPITRRDIRPNDWGLIWPELNNKKNSQ